MRFAALFVIGASLYLCGLSVRLAGLLICKDALKCA
jgi:hypothetical protein